MTPEQIIVLIQSARDAVRAYAPTNPTYEGSVQAYFNIAGDNLDRSISYIELAAIEENGTFTLPDAGLGV